MPEDEGAKIEGTLLEWDSRPQVWAQFAAAGLHAGVSVELAAVVKDAAAIADDLLAEYEQRFPNADRPVEVPVPGADGGA